MKRCLVVLVVLFCGLPQVPAWADQAREAYQRGRTHYKNGEYAAAIVELKKAYDLKPHPALLRYMGDAYFKLNKARQAISHYKLYLKEAPMAADREKVETKVKQLELVLGEETSPAPTPAPTPEPAPVPVPTPAPEPTTPPTDLTPTGEDTEVPVALRQKKVPPPGSQQEQQSDGSSALTITKWVTLVAGAAGIGLGIAGMVLSAKNEGDLQDAVKTGCLPDEPTCDPNKVNPEMNDPKVPYSEGHFDLQQSFKRNRIMGIVGLVAGGVLTGTSIALFVLDAGAKKEERRRRVSIAPLVAGGFYGLGGHVSF